MVMASCQQQRFHPPDNTRRRRVSSMPKQLEASFHLQPHFAPSGPLVIGCEMREIRSREIKSGGKSFLVALHFCYARYFFFFSDFYIHIYRKDYDLEFLSSVLPSARTGIGIWGADGRIGHKLDYYLQIPHSLIG